LNEPLSLAVYDHRTCHVFQELVDDNPPTYENHPQRNLSRRTKSHSAVDRLIPACRDIPFSAGKIEPVIDRCKIDMAEVEPRSHRTCSSISSGGPAVVLWRALGLVP
jgi:hypothetical protein